MGVDFQNQLSKIFQLKDSKEYKVTKNKLSIKKIFFFKRIILIPVKKNVIGITIEIKPKDW